MITAGDELDGRYRVLSRVGAGAFGEVFLAEDVRLGRRVVVKVLGDAGPGAIDRLAKEFRLLSQLDDAAFARVYGVGDGCRPGMPGSKSSSRSRRLWWGSRRGSSRS